MLSAQGAWLLVVLTLLASAERRIAAYSDWPGSEPVVRGADTLKDGRVFHGLLAVHDSEPPGLEPFRATESVHREPDGGTVSLLPPSPSAPRAPPSIPAAHQPTT